MWLLSCLGSSCLFFFAQDEGPRDTTDRKVSDLEFSEAELMGEEGVWASGKRWGRLLQARIQEPLLPTSPTDHATCISRRHICLLCGH